MNLPKLDLKSPAGQKKALIVAGGGAAVLVGWAWYRNGQINADDTPAAGTAPTDDGYVTQATPGEESGTGTTAGAGGNVGDTGGTPGVPITNAEWTQFVVDQMSDSWEPSVVRAALGKYLGRQPLTEAEQLIVRAALATGGPPPQGTFTVIPVVGSTPVTPTPTTPKPTTPTTPAKPKPTTPAKPAPKPKVPAHYTYVVTKSGTTLSSIGKKYGKSWQQVWDFNLKYRSASAVKTMKARGPNVIYRGSTWWVPK